MQANQDLTTFDRNQDHHYLDHLVDLNNDQPVTASEDVYNQFGVLLIAKGSPINPRIAKQLHQHRLAKPLDVQIELETTLSQEGILRDIYSLLQACPEFSAIHQAHDFDAGLKHLCLNSNLPPLMRQRLTVMKNRCPDRYQHSLFSAWMCGLFSIVLKLNIEKSLEAFVCGLIHDIGFLHISPELLGSNQDLSEESWRALQSHVLIGKILVDELGLYSSEVGFAIVEHHERMDLTGYPSRKDPQKLGLYGQMVGCVDLIHNLSNNELARQGQPLSASLSHLKVNHSAYRDDVYQAAFNVLSKVEYAAVTGTDNSVLHQRIGAINELLNGLMVKLKSLNDRSVAIDSSLEGSSVYRLISMIFKTFDSAGLDSSIVSQWMTLEVDADDADFYQTLVETDSIQYELLWLFKRLGWGIEEVLKQQKGLKSDTRQAMLGFAKEMESSLGAGWEQYQR
ncbi:MAG: HD domain-containing phosphohydrolase [Motiliproteus sp.]